MPAFYVVIQLDLVTKINKWTENCRNCPFFLPNKAMISEIKAKIFIFHYKNIPKIPGNRES